MVIVHELVLSIPALAEGLELYKSVQYRMEIGTGFDGSNENKHTGFF